MTQLGFKPLPLSLKIVFILSSLWILGSIMSITTRYDLGLPFMGFWVSGIFAALIVLILDILGPAAFLFATYSQLSWAPKVAYTYLGFFILNSFIAFILYKKELGGNAILTPLIITILFLAIIYKTENIIIKSFNK